MFLSRKIGKLLRGNATAPQVILACVLGGVLGFVPGFFLPGDLGGGFRQSPALILGLLFLVLVLNANLAVFGLATLLAKLASFVLLPVSFAIGRALLDGPAKGLAETLVQAPFFAWCGLEHYATTGGLVLGLLFGITLGILVWKGLRAFRKKMAGVEAGSERYRQVMSKRWVRVLAWVFLGGKSKRSYEELAETRGGSPVRILGVVVVVVLGVSLFLLQSFLAGPAVRNAVQTQLQYLNGATVDLARLGIDLGDGRIGIEGLAVADRTALDTDRFRARNLDLRIDTTDLLRKQFVVDTITSTEAATGQARETPGVVIQNPKEPPVEPPPSEGGKTLDDYLKDAKKWKERLKQVSDWLESVTGGEEAPPETPEERDRRIAIETDVLGYTNVVAKHLIRQKPTLLIRSMNLEGVVSAELAGDLIDVRAKNLSTHPSRVDEPLEISILSRSGKLSFVARYDTKAGVTTSFAFRGVATDAVVGQLKGTPLSGGTLDFAMDGALSRGPAGIVVDLPLQVTLHNTTLAIPGLAPTEVNGVMLPLGVRGPLAAPRITVDDGQIADALMQAGKQELARQLRTQADALLKGVPGVGEGVGRDLGEVLEGTKTPEQLLDEARKKAEEEARKRAEEELKKRLPGGLGGLLPGKKKEGEK
jgi:uncharacterized protein (TIGR03546 family)